jgi:clan AA aspartic protease
MGLTYITVTVINPARPGKKVKTRFLVDSGATYTVAPKGILQRLGIKPHGSRTFTLADGTKFTRKIGDAVFSIDGERAASPVIFGEKGDSSLFGTVSLGALGFVLDPIRRELRRLPMLLG